MVESLPADAEGGGSIHSWEDSTCLRAAGPEPQRSNPPPEPHSATRSHESCCSQREPVCGAGPRAATDTHACFQEMQDFSVSMELSATPPSKFRKFPSS